MRVEQSLVAVETILGWCLSGSFKSSRRIGTSANFVASQVLEVQCEKTEKVHDNEFDRFWKIEDCSVGNGDLTFKAF